MNLALVFGTKRLTSFTTPHHTACDPKHMTFYQLIDQAIFTAYRLGGWVLLNAMDDPALLAIVFC